jgi:hypothetical protein
MDGWMEGKAGLRIAYSNQKVTLHYGHLLITKVEQKISVFLHLGIHFRKIGGGGEREGGGDNTLALSKFRKIRRCVFSGNF